MPNFKSNLNHNFNQIDSFRKILKVALGENTVHQTIITQKQLK